MVITEQEQVEIGKAVKEYDRKCEEQLAREAEYAVRSLKENNPLDEIYQEFEKINTESIQIHQESIGILVKLRERGNGEIRERVRDLINLETYEIELLRKDILSDRDFIKKLSR